MNDSSQVIQELDIQVGEGEPKAIVTQPRRPYAGHQFAGYGLLLQSRPIRIGTHALALVGTRNPARRTSAFSSAR